MANLNDYKLLSQKSLRYFELISKEFDIDHDKIDEINQARFGFYYYVLELITGNSDISEINEMITDMDYNAKLFRKPNQDFGIDAIFIDDDKHIIQLFNFKYRESFNPDKEQNLNESIASLKFINSIMNNNITDFKGKIKTFAQSIINNIKSNEIWNIELYIISNENKTLSPSISDFKNIKDIYDIETITIGLNELKKYMSLRPKPINSIVHLSNDALFPFEESSRSSSKSFVIRLSASELIRITCDDEQLRNNYNLEDYSILSSRELDYDVLFDNVRGFIVKSKFNEKMSETLLNEPEKFFMYNNGLTITASKIIAEDTNTKTKTKLTLQDLQIVNGGQTLRTIHSFNKLSTDNIFKLSNCQILIRIFETIPESTTKSNIAEYTNSQNSINIKDLKSLASEQIAIEEYCDDKGIIYSRKNGDTGFPDKSYSRKISMEKTGQILYSIYGSPERASNYKKEIFSKYYDSLFKNPDYNVEFITKSIISYFEIKQAYKKSKYKISEQKVFYILYLHNLIPLDDYAKEISFFETALSTFKSEEKDARKLILSSFKDTITKSYIKTFKKSRK